MPVTTRDYERIAGEYLSHWVDKGRVEGLAVGLAEGRVRGLAEGETKGVAKGEAKAILAVLRTRGIAISSESEDRISQCTDLGLLDLWIRKAVTATSVDELFD
ncbi:hypothetical protein GCM10009530_54020 [Microbispora corallina]|uniref:Transposase n=1 Tax=Microbispora corallina TaxID=83302 RepID=A0ABQ4G4S8_9ACTN|nr:hypothetical protein Mco01_50440 [Microbispora corallina]